MTPPAHIFLVPVQDQGQRLDVWLSQKFTLYSRSQWQRRIEEGEITVEGRPIARPGYKIQQGQSIRWAAAPVRPVSDQPENIPLDILYEDNHLLVVNKPAGMIVHPAPGHETGTLVNALLAHCGPLPFPSYEPAALDEEEVLESSEVVSQEFRPAIGSNLAIGGEHRPGIVHRLDQGTSGLLVCAKDEPTLRGLQKQFQAHTISRKYWAVVLGVVPEQGSFRTPYGRHPYDRKRFTGRRGTKHAITHYRVLERLPGATWVEVTLETGRTHQIRVHFSESGHPILGDPLYGKPPSGSSPVATIRKSLTHQALHAHLLGFTHPITSKPLLFSALPPPVFQHTVEQLRSLTRKV